MYHFKFSDIGEGLHQGKILSINIKENQIIKEGQVMFSVETDKVSTEITAPISGKVFKIYFQEGEIIKVGDIVVDIENGKAIISNSAPSVVGSIDSSDTLLPRFDNLISTVNNDKKVLISPLARKKARENNVIINDLLIGSGPQGRILLKDVNKKVNIDTPKMIENLHDITYENLSTIRKVIAKNMIKSKQTIPEACLFRKIDISNLVKLRNELKTNFAEQKLYLTYLPFIIKALGKSLAQFKKFNCIFDQNSDRIIFKNSYNIGVAIDTIHGLVVPVIKNVNEKSLSEITKDLNDLTNKAKNNILDINDIKDGSFTITNYGTVGIEYGTPIIKHPEVAILGTGLISKNVVILEDGNWSVRHILPISMTIDHRIIDGADAGKFLQNLNNHLTQPHLLI